jgi:ATPase family associated with various cellular activities (AAA)
MSELSPNASATARRILAVKRLRARRLALWMEHLWRSGEASPDQGPAIGPGEVARLIDAEATRAAEAELFASGRAAALSADIDTAAEELAADPAWTTIRNVFALSDAEADLLALLVAVEFDPGLGRVVAYLHDDGRLFQPTPWLAARLAGREPAPFAGAALLTWQLAKPLDEAGAGPRLMVPWQVDPAVALSVFSGHWHDPAIAAAATTIAVEPAAALPCLHEAARDTLLALADLRDAELVGPPGIGRQTLAAQIAGASGRLLLAADLPTLIAAGASAAQALTRTLRQAAITGALVYFRDADAASEADWARARRLGVPYLRGVRHPTGAPLPVVLAPLTIAARLALWHYASKAPPPEALIAHRLSPAEIMRGAAMPDLAPLLRQRGRRPDSALLTRLPCPYEWDDLVLPADVVGQLRAFEAQVRLRWSVYEEWDFGRLAHLGHGIAALFGGPSGTGKTMAAQVLARALGLELLRVDLAGVVNKYIGETEKKLREVFDACEDSGALLFFDEADALFGTRTQVKDAHDRFANIEIDYLLQRVERFDGVAILATNRRKDLDPAFVRRLRFVVEFEVPRPDERLALWQRALLTRAPNGDALLDELDWGYLAQRLNMTGAEIKGTALGAAFMARAEGTRIGMRHLLAAAQREMAKQGVRLRVPLQEANR